MIKRQYRNGFLLLEYILACCIFLLLAGIALPYMERTQRHDADVFTRELAMDLHRMRQLAVANGFAANDAWTLSLRKDRYMIIRQYTVQKTRIYPDGVTIPLGSSRKDVSFNANGKPKGNMEFTISLADDPSYRRTIIVAAQTGRIRIE